MELKLHLNKFLRVDNIENYTLKTLKILQSKYQEFLDNSEGVDPDYPMFTFGGKGKKVGGFNPHYGNEGEDDMSSQSGNINGLLDL